MNGWSGSARGGSSLLSCLALVLGLLAPAEALASGWKLVFEDNFDGKELDRKKWATRYIYGGETLDKVNDEIQVFRDNDNHVVHDGQLDLVARKPADNRVESGMIRSLRTFYYGYFEARVRFPKGIGVMPGFWLNPDYDLDGKLTWPPEIDVFEFAVNGKEDTSSMFHSAAIQVPRNKPFTYSYADKDYIQKFGSFVAPKPLTEDWHVFGLVWTPNDITVFLDGKRIYTRDYQWTSAPDKIGPPAHVLLNFALGGAWGGRYGVDPEYPKIYSVDYVRVCQFTKSGTGGSRCGDSKFTPDPAVFGYDAPYDDLAKPALRCLAIGAASDCIANAKPGQRVDVKSEVGIPDGGLGDRRMIFMLQSTDDPKKTATVGQLDLPAQHNSGTQSLSNTITIPASLPTGDYDLRQSLFTKDTDKDHPSGRPTPLKCDTPAFLADKWISCVLGRVHVQKK